MMLRKLLAILLLCPVLQARVVHVPSTEAPTIQIGINRAILNDTVLVADGVYTGTGNYNIDLKRRSVLMSEHGPEYTIIDCQGSSSERRRAFLFWRGEDSNTVVEGFTIRGGYAPVDYEDEYHDLYSAGGAMMFLNNSSPVIRNCTFTQNYAVHLGGAVLCAGSSPSFVDCLFEDNYVEAHGGAVYACEYSTPEFSGTSFLLNSASKGGAVYISGTGAVFADCIFSQNYAGYGGGLTVTGTSNVNLVDCIISENKVYWQGGGYGSYRNGAQRYPARGAKSMTTQFFTMLVVESQHLSTCLLRLLNVRSAGMKREPEEGWLSLVVVSLTCRLLTASSLRTRVGACISVAAHVS